jgi:plastocyanin
VSHDSVTSRRNALKCLAFGSAGTLFALSGGVLAPIDLAEAAARPERATALGKPLFLQISDSHIGFNKDANPDVNATLTRTINLVNGLPEQPALILHTGDITHLSKAAEFDTAQQLLGQLRTKELYTVPGEHDVSDEKVVEYFNRFGKVSNNKGYYSFDHAGVHFIGLINVLEFKAGGLGTLGKPQLDWVTQDLKGRSSSTPIVVFAHMPLWTIYEPWGWGTGDADQLMSQLRRFGSVTVLNGHIHQIVQKVEGNITFHTARSTAYPQPVAGQGAGPGPLKVSTEQLPGMLGITTFTRPKRGATFALNDTTIASTAAVASTAGSSDHAGNGADSKAGGGGSDPQVEMKEFMFHPTSLKVKAHSTVKWINKDGEPHTVISLTGLFRSSALDTNDSFSFKFDNPGTYQFVCSIHPRMTGTIEVE